MDAVSDPCAVLSIRRRKSTPGLRRTCDVPPTTYVATSDLDLVREALRSGEIVVAGESYLRIDRASTWSDCPIQTLYVYCYRGGPWLGGAKLRRIGSSRGHIHGIYVARADLEVIKANRAELNSASVCAAASCRKDSN